MLEWYGPGTYEEAMSQTRTLVCLADRALSAGGPVYTDGPWQTYELRELFLKATGIDPFPLGREDLFSRMSAQGFQGLENDDAWEDLL